MLTDAVLIVGVAGVLVTPGLFAYLWPRLWFKIVWFVAIWFVIALTYQGLRY